MYKLYTLEYHITYYYVYHETFFDVEIVMMYKIILKKYLVH